MRVINEHLVGIKCRSSGFVKVINDHLIGTMTFILGKC